MFVNFTDNYSELNLNRLLTINYMNDVNRDGKDLNNLNLVRRGAN